MKLPIREWIPLISSGAALLLLVFWLLRYLRVMAPRRGTLEWIRRADRGRFSPVSLQPVRGSGAILLAVMLAGGIGCGLWMAREDPSGRLHSVLLWAAQLPAAALIFLLLFGAWLPAACGTALLAAAGMPSPLLLTALLLMLLSLACRRLSARMALLLPALLLVYPVMGIGFPTLLLLLSYLLLQLLCAKLREPHPAPGIPAGTALLLLEMAAVLLLMLQLSQTGGRLSSALMLDALGQLIRWEFRPLSGISLPALLPAILIPALLLQARDLRSSIWLFAALAALLGLQFLFFGHPELACLGSITALTASFAGADRRGGRGAAVTTAAILMLLILTV